MHHLVGDDILEVAARCERVEVRGIELHDADRRVITCRGAANEAGTGLCEHPALTIDRPDRGVDQNIVDDLIEVGLTLHAALRRVDRPAARVGVDDVAGDDRADARRCVCEQRLLVGRHCGAPEPYLDVVAGLHVGADVPGDAICLGTHRLREGTLAESPRGSRCYAGSVGGCGGTDSAAGEAAASRDDRERHGDIRNALAVRVLHGDLNRCRELGVRERGLRRARHNVDLGRGPDLAWTVVTACAREGRAQHEDPTAGRDTHTERLPLGKPAQSVPESDWRWGLHYTPMPVRRSVTVATTAALAMFDVTFPSVLKRSGMTSTAIRIATPSTGIPISAKMGAMRKSDQLGMGGTLLLSRTESKASVATSDDMKSTSYHVPKYDY